MILVLRPPVQFPDTSPGIVYDVDPRAKLMGLIRLA